MCVAKDDFECFHPSASTSWVMGSKCITAWQSLSLLQHKPESGGRDIRDGYHDQLSSEGEEGGSG